MFCCAVVCFTRIVIYAPPPPLRDCYLRLVNFNPRGAVVAGRGAETGTVPPRRDEGMCLFALERYVESIDTLAGYLEAEPGAEDASQVGRGAEPSRMKSMD